MILTTVVGQVEDGYPSIPNNSIDLIVTSPPYFRQDGWTPALMPATGALFARVLKPGGRAFLVFGQVKEDLGRPFVTREAILAGGCDCGRPQLIGWQTIIWAKSIAVNETTYGHFQPISSPQLLNYCFEYVFQFIKGDAKTAPALDRLAVGAPYMDKTNLTRGTRGKNGDVHCAGDIWFQPYPTTGHTDKKTHHHEFPVALVERAIKVSGVPPGSTIFDPFGGGGTVGEAAVKLGMNAVLGDRYASSLVNASARWELARQSCG